MKTIAHLFEDPKTGILWMHHQAMEESYRVKTIRGTLDLAKLQETQAELVSLHNFGLCMASYDLVTVKNKDNMYAVMSPFNDTMGCGAVYASICEGFAFKSAFGFTTKFGGDDYVVAENADGKWGLIKISRTGTIWWEYNGVSFTTPETLIYFDCDSMADVLYRSNLMIPATSLLNTFSGEYIIDLTKPERRDLKEMGASLDTIRGMREFKKLTQPSTQTSQDSQEDSVKFGWQIRRKLFGWYQKIEHFDKAVDRIVRQREEIINLLESVKKYDTKELIKYLDKSGFFYRPSSASRHHNFPGGLAEHSLGTYRIVEEWNLLSPAERRKTELYGKHLKGKKVNCDIFNEKMDHDDMIIAAICHDLCKAEHYYFDGRVIKPHVSDSEPRNAHASLSVKRLFANGIDTSSNDEMRLAVLMHMHLFRDPRYPKEAQNQQKGRGSMLAIAVWGADKLDASRHPAGVNRRP